MPIKERRDGKQWISRPRRLSEFVTELNRWKLGKRGRDKLRPQDYKKKFSYSAVQSWFLPAPNNELGGRRKPSTHDAEILRRKICWVRRECPYRVPETVIGTRTVPAQQK